MPQKTLRRGAAKKSGPKSGKIAGRTSGKGAPPKALSADSFMKAYESRAYAEARRIAEALLIRDPDWTEAKIAYAQLLYEQFGEVERPIALLEAILERDPALPRVLTLLASIHTSIGQKDQAVLLARRCVEASPETPEAYLTLWRADASQGEALAAEIERVLGERSTTDRQKLVFHSTLGQIFDRIGDVDRAFAEFTAANRMRPAAYSALHMERRYLNMARRFDAETIANLRRHGVGDTKPVFILGMPRSGSTLLERIVSRHPSVDTAGERTEMAKICEDLREIHGAPIAGNPGCCDYFGDLSKIEIRTAANRYLALLRPALKNPNALRWIDKMPGNFMLVGFIQALLPKARIIHAHRDPLDVALSCYTQSFFEGHEYAQNLQALAHYMAIQRRFMAHWRTVSETPILDVRYRDVVADLEGQARRALDHLGLDWNEDCLTPQQSDRAVLTASVDQVRKPIYDSSLGKWRRYERHLAPLFDTWRAMGSDVLDDMLSACNDPTVRSAA